MSDLRARAHAVVTGSSGFIGRHLIAALAARGDTVVGIDRRPAVPGAPGIHVQLDLADPASRVIVSDVLRSAEVVFHLAARPGVRGSGPEIAVARQRDNVDAGRVVLEETPPDTPIVVTSSSSVYGGARVVDGVVRASHESDPLRPLGGYACSKVELERLCEARVAAGGLVMVARPFTAVGEHQRDDMALTRWLRAALAGRPLPVLGSLERLRDFTDVHGVVRALLALAAHGEPVVVNVGTGRPRSLGEVVASIEAVLDRELTVDVVPAGTEEPAATRAHTARCERVCGFVPVTDLVAVVRRTLDVLADVHAAEPALVGSR